MAPDPLALRLVKAARERSANSEPGAIPTTSASISVLIPWQYIGPWLVFETINPFGFWCAST